MATEKIVLFEQVATFITGSVLLLGFLGFIARKVFIHFLDKDIESYKTKVKAESDKRHFIFQRLYEKRLDIISVLYERSVEAARATSYAVQMQGNVKDEDVPDLERKVKAFKEQYEVARLWLDNDSCKAIDGVLDHHSMFYKVLTAADLKKYGLGEGWVGKKYLDLWEQADKELPKAQDMLRIQFQKMMDRFES